MTCIDRRYHFRTLYRADAPLKRAAALFGLTAEEMGIALHYAALTKAMQPAPNLPKAIYLEWDKPVHNRVFCDQCDRLVKREEAGICSSQFCKAKELT